MKRWWLVVLCFLGTSISVSAQDLDVEGLDLPTSVTREVVAFFGDPGTRLVEGDLRVDSAEFVQGPLAVLEGVLVVSGTVEGDVMVINGDVRLEAGGSIDGDLTVIGGEYTGEQAQVTGAIAIYEERYDFERRTRSLRGRNRDPYASDNPRRWARSKFSTRSEVNYNRVEGLPIMVGPVFQSGREVNSRVDLMAIFRTESGFAINPDKMGYFLRAEQSLGRWNRFTVAATVHSLIEPLDRWRLDDFEASMGTLLLHEDYRDYYEREGFSLSARARIPDAGLFLEFEYRDEEHTFAPANNPWSLRDDDRAWRPQPLVAEGTVRTLRGEITVDARDDSDNPTDGWYFSARGTYGLSGDLAVPAYLEPTPRPSTLAASARPMPTDFRTGLVDLRRYTRLGPDSDFRMRGLLAGTLTNDPLPPQYQNALGGVGSLPGHDLLSLDCGARDRLYSLARAGGGRVDAFPGYGCDRVALFQAQYRGRFSLGWDEDEDWGNDWDWYPSADFSPSWTVFFNAARGWTSSRVGEPGFLGPDTETMMDAGAGFYIGGLGLYWAWPLTGDERRGKFFVRLEHRF